MALSRMYLFRKATTAFIFVFFFIFIFIFTVGPFSSRLSAQTKLKLPAVEIFGGYSHLRFESTQLGFANRLNLNGADVEVSLPDLYEGLGIAADAAYSLEEAFTGRAVACRGPHQRLHLDPAINPALVYRLRGPTKLANKSGGA